MDQNLQKRLVLGEIEKLEADLANPKTPAEEKDYLSNKIDDLNKQLEELSDGS